MYQWSVGRYFIHEQSSGNMSWYNGVVPALVNTAGTHTWEGQVDNGGFIQYQVTPPGIGWLSNSSSIVQELGRWAVDGGDGPHSLAKAMLRGLRVQVLNTGEMSLNTIGVGVAEEEHEFQ